MKYKIIRIKLSSSFRKEKPVCDEKIPLEADYCNIPSQTLCDVVGLRLNIILVLHKD